MNRNTLDESANIAENGDAEVKVSEAEAAAEASDDPAAELEAEVEEAPAGEAVQLELPNLDDIRAEDFVDAVEAIIFAAGEPVTLGDIKKVMERTWAEDHETVRAHKLALVKDALKLLKKRWAVDAETRGFNLAEVADGWTFRSNAKWASYLRSTTEQRPVRMSRPALETLAIIAYRQPATKPEIDHIRGVDCGATIRLLLDRNLVRIVGKREEPGRPMLYGTTKEFLSFFNLASLGQLPSLREFSELTEESQEEITQTLGEMPTLDDLSRNAKKLRLDEEPAVQALDEAVLGLDATETKTRDAFASQGISIDPAAENPAEPVVAERETGT
ncbi:MAG: SMC-Scp complex subunit ScpB [Myxococcota bacterium]